MIYRRIILLFFALLPLFSIAQKKVAVMETTRMTEEVTMMQCQMVRGGLETAVANTSGYEGYDRTSFDAIMSEQNFQRSGAVSDAQIRKLGEMAGVQYIIVSEATAEEGQFYVLVKMLDVETGKYGAAYDKLCTASPIEIKKACAELGTKILGPTRQELEKIRLQQEEEQRIAEQKRKEAERIAEQKRKEAEAEAERKRKEEMKNRSWRDLVKIGTSNAVKKYSDGGWYIGGFVGGEREGYGMYGWSDGDLYIGNFEDNHRENSGTYIVNSGYLNNCPNSLAYVGWWRNGNKDDTGTIYNKQGKLIYYGKFRGDAPKDSYPSSGYSEYTFNVIDYDDGAKYVGEMYNGKRHGKGMYIWNDGRIWYGEWNDGQRNGYGIYIYEKGAKYQKGNWIGDTKQ